MSLAFVIVACYALVSALFYLGLMLYYRKGINNIYTPIIKENDGATFITIVICFRNEEANLSQLLTCLVAQSYPAKRFEIVLYNDNSSDGSLAEIKNIQSQCKTHQIICRDVLLTEASHSPKKMALNHAVQNSMADLMVVTDADCLLHNEWLSLIEQTYLNKKALLIAAPVAIIAAPSLLNELQSLEMQALTAVTAGAIGNNKALMCNGANLAFDRKKFLALDPYKYNQHISSGDDMFLMMEIQKKHSANIVFLAHEKATVYTKSKNSLSTYIDQRIRWASKSKHYQANSIKWVALLVLNMNAVLFLAPLTIFFFSWDQGFVLFFILLVIKQVADIAGLAKFSRIINKEVKYAKFLLFQYIEALLTLIVALKSIKGSYVWKDRKQHF